MINQIDDMKKEFLKDDERTRKNAKIKRELAKINLCGVVYDIEKCVLKETGYEFVSDIHAVYGVNMDPIIRTKYESILKKLFPDLDPLVASHELSIRVFDIKNKRNAIAHPFLNQKFLDDLLKDEAYLPDDVDFWVNLIRHYKSLM
jgi:hypothetical protein